MTERRIIPTYRYREAEAIVDRWRGGEDSQITADDFDLDHTANGQRIVELIVAAYDRRGTHYPQ